MYGKKADQKQSNMTSGGCAAKVRQSLGSPNSKRNNDGNSSTKKTNKGNSHSYENLLL